MSRVIIRPGTGRYITDTPAHLLDPKTDFAFAQDALTPDEKLVQRKGWAYDGTVADVAANLIGVYRAKFVRSNVTRTITTTSSGVYIHNSGASGTLLSEHDGSSLDGGIPRCVYGDELFITAQNGTTNLMRYSGALTRVTAIVSGPTYTLGEATISGGTAMASIPELGTYVFANAGTTGASGSNYFIGWRIVGATSTSSVTIQDIRASTTLATGLFWTVAQMAGHMFPCVSIYSTGTVTSVSGGGVTGYGTRWASDMTAENSQTTVLINDNGTWRMSGACSVSSNTSITGHEPTVATKSPYHIAASPTFTDTASHKGSLWGVGVKAYPSRVYVSPPGWNPSLPPGAVAPFDPTVAVTSTTPGYFLLNNFDVPNPNDSDPIVAILSSPGPLWVLKRNSIHAIDGSYPDFSQRLIAGGIGCVDLRSAIRVDEGLFWCGEGGIYWSPNGANIVDLTDGKMNREWRALTRAAGTTFGSTSYVTCGIAHGHLVVSGSFGGTARSFLYDLRRKEWMGRLSNLTARYMFSSRISGEIEQLFFVDDSEQGRVMNFAPAINLSGIAKDGDGVSPALQVHTAQNFVGELAEEARLLDVEVSANVYDAGVAGSTQLDMTLEHSGGLLSGGAGVQTKTLTSIDSDTTDLIDRHPRQVNRSGRLHQLKLAVSPTGTNDANTKVEVSEITFNFREGRKRT